MSLAMLADYGLLLLLLCLSIPFSMEYPLDGKQLMIDLPVELLLLVLSALVLLLTLAGRGLRSSFWYHPLVFILLLQFGWAMASTVVSESPMASIKYLIQKLWFLLACVGLPYLYLQRQAHYRNMWVLYGMGMLAVMVYVTVRHGLHGFAWEEINPAVVPFYHNHVLYGCGAALLVPMAWCLRSWQRQRGGVGVRGSLLLLAALAATFFSYTRASWLSILLLPVVALLVHRGWIGRLLPVLFVGLLVLIGWLLQDNYYLQLAPEYKTTVMHDRLDQHLEATISGRDVSGMERVYRWVAAKRMIAEHPLLGSGPDSFYPTYFSHSVEAFRTYVSDNPERSTTHNYFLMITAEQGIPGLLLFLAGIFYFFARGGYLYRQAVSPFSRTLLMCLLLTMVVFLTHLVLNDLVENNKVGLLYYFLLAMLIRLDVQHRQAAGSL
ncbi:MAG: O-antigen ligase family protein [Bacteroidetes bacterium]|nr:O-antigen ligase family protein [Bacteroidota bacterium]